MGGFFSSCSDNKNNTFQDKNGDDSITVKETGKGLSNILLFRDTLIITAEYDECGEFGGHREILTLTSDGKVINGHFTIDSVPCQITSETGVSVVDDELRVYLLDTTKIIDSSDEKVINEFLHRLIEMKLNFNPYYVDNYSDSIDEEEPINIYFDASVIKVKISGTGLYLVLNNYDHLINTKYAWLRKELFELNAKPINQTIYEWLSFEKGKLSKRKLTPAG